jgi:methyl-accepting chemotaxis protein
MKLAWRVLCVPLLAASVALGAGAVHGVPMLDASATSRQGFTTDAEDYKTTLAVQEKLGLVHGSVYRTLALLDSMDDKATQAFLAEVTAQLADAKKQVAGIVTHAEGDQALTAAVNGAAPLLDKYLQSVHKAVELSEAVARGELDVELDSKRPDEAGDLVRSMGKMVRQLRESMHTVKDASGNIAHASSEIASGNLDLSRRTEQSAASLQQTTGSMAQLTGAVRQSADAAAQANQLAATAAEVAQRGGKVVAEVVTTMEQINRSSKKIADIIGTIDGIAFQTNILALNAAVEAARAGEQSAGIAQVNTAISELDRMTQQNAALVEESAAAAESLKSQAASLGQVVGRFALGHAAASATVTDGTARGRVATQLPSHQLAKVVLNKAKAAAPAKPAVPAKNAVRNAPAAAVGNDEWTSFQTHAA